MNILDKTKEWYKDLPEKKKYIELLTAVLTVPVLITVIISNFNNLNKNKDASKEEPKVEKQTVYIVPTKDKLVGTNAPTPTDSVKGTATECKKEVGPVEIVNPDEDEVITSNSVCIDISYKVEEYCSVAWSYKLNDSTWSEYTDKSICLYNLSSGDKKLELRVKSIASQDEKILKRNFIYKSTLTPGIEITKSSSSSAQ